MPNKKEEDNEEKQSLPTIAVGRRPTREDLSKVVAAARDATAAALEAADIALVTIEGPAGDGQVDEIAVARTKTGNAAQATGHGTLAGGIRKHEGPAAYEQFMAALKGPLKKAGDKVRVSDRAGWIKIEGMQGHKVYIAKTKTGVSRVESTLDPTLLEGASAPDRPNGMIASWLPADTDVVAKAIGLLVSVKESPQPRPRGQGQDTSEQD